MLARRRPVDSTHRLIDDTASATDDRMTAPAFPTGTILGYPRIGRRRELKRAVEAFWAGRIDAAELEATRGRPARGDARAPRRARPRPHRLRRSPSRSRTTTRCSTPRSPSARFRRASPTSRDDDGAVDLAGYFTIARGEGDRRAARDDEVVRLELPLPRARDRSRDRVLARERSPRRARSPRRRRPASPPARSSSAR